MIIKKETFITCIYLNLGCKTIKAHHQCSFSPIMSARVEKYYSPHHAVNSRAAALIAYHCFMTPAWV